MDYQKVRRLLLNRVVGVTFIVLMGGMYVAFFGLGNPDFWPFTELGRRTTLLFGCGVYSCILLAWGLGIIYTYICSVILGVVAYAVLPESPSQQ